mmetsp:Transcript_791/g.842  ORF Transcript_791/g.842 Transcript_791/m.842 type:complete len:92 (-) Transcript_791:597-872(-)
MIVVFQGKRINTRIHPQALAYGDASQALSCSLTTTCSTVIIIRFKQVIHRQVFINLFIEVIIIGFHELLFLAFLVPILGLNLSLVPSLFFS